MGKERSSNTNTLVSQPKPAVILPKTVEQATPTYLESKYIHDLLFLANQASAVFYREVVMAAEESLSGKQREAGGEGRSCFGLSKNLWRKLELFVRQAALVEEAKHPSNRCCREERLFGKKYVRRKKSKVHMDSTSTSNLVPKSSSQKERGKYSSNAETHLNCEQVEAVDGQEGRCSGMKKGVSNASRCNQWWNFKTRPRTSRGIRRRHVQWSKKRKRNCMTFEDTQSNRKILLLAIEAITHQLGLLDVSMEEEKSSYK